jgi:hypothetical protein
MADNNGKLIHAPTFDVPLVGQALKVYSTFIFSEVTCQCKPDNQPFLIRGQDMIAICSVCKRGYQIARVAYNGRQSPAVIVEIDTVRIPT